MTSAAPVFQETVCAFFFKTHSFSKVKVAFILRYTRSHDLECLVLKKRTCETAHAFAFESSRYIVYPVRPDTSHPLCLKIFTLEKSSRDEIPVERTPKSRPGC